MKQYGKPFWCVDETGSGCVCIGIEREGKKYFYKIAGVNTIEAEVTPEESIRVLKDAVSLYYELEHPNLVKIVEQFTYGEFYVVVFEWADGDCLFDHWNFQKYEKDKTLKTPKEKFRELPVSKKLLMIDVLVSFLENVNRKGYVAVDFYDGSILYDFVTDRITICDIDLFQKAPVVNDKGADWYGTKRLKAPEEYRKGSIINEQTNIFTLGALIFEFFGSYSAKEVEQRYIQNRFVPCSYERWQLNDKSYHIALKAVNANRKERYQTFEEFYKDWQKANQE